MQPVRDCCNGGRYEDRGLPLRRWPASHTRAPRFPGKQEIPLQGNSRQACEQVVVKSIKHIMDDRQEHCYSVFLEDLANAFALCTCVDESAPYLDAFMSHVPRCLAQGTNAWTDVDSTAYTVTTVVSLSLRFTHEFSRNPKLFALAPAPHPLFNNIMDNR